MAKAFETATVTDKGLNPHYSINEDSYLVLEHEGVLAVADGVGGAHAGDLASQSALRVVDQCIKRYSSRFKKDKIGFVQKLIEAANRIVFEMGSKKEKQMASTIAIMVMEQDYAVLGHVGDSRIYLARNGQLTQLTKDHSKLQALLDANPELSLTRESYYGGHILTKALGVSRQVEPDIQKVILKNGDIFVLCTDGIYTHNSDEEMLNTIKEKQDNLDNVCEAFKKKCYQEGAKDNLTAVVLRVHTEEEAEGETKTIKNH